MFLSRNSTEAHRVEYNYNWTEKNCLQLIGVSDSLGILQRCIYKDESGDNEDEIY